MNQKWKEEKEKEIDLDNRKVEIVKFSQILDFGSQSLLKNNNNKKKQCKQIDQCTKPGYYEVLIINEWYIYLANFSTWLNYGLFWFWF